MKKKISVIVFLLGFLMSIFSIGVNAQDQSNREREKIATILEKSP